MIKILNSDILTLKTKKTIKIARVEQVQSSYPTKIKWIATIEKTCPVTFSKEAQKNQFLIDNFYF